MGKGQHPGGEITAPGQGQHQAQKAISGGRTQGRPCLQYARADAGERGLQWLGGKGQGVNHGCQHQTGESKVERAPRQVEPERAQATVRGKPEQQVKAHHRGWQHQG